VSAIPEIPQISVDMMSPNSGTASTIRVTEPERFSSYEQGSSPVVRKRRLKNGELIEETYIPVYYPGVVESQAASPIALAAGATVGGVDISVAAAVIPARHIRGKVLDATNGQPLSNAGVLATPLSTDPLRTIPSASSDANGNFDLRGVAPGHYVLSYTNRLLNGMTSIEVANADLENITVVAMPLFNIFGKFFIEGLSSNGRELSLTDLRVAQFTRVPQLMGLPSAGFSFNPPATPDGSFTLQGVWTGDFRITVRTGSPDAYVKSIRMGDVDVLDSGLHISAKPENPVEIVVGVNAGRVNGSVVNARQEPLSNRTVVLVPDVRFRHRVDLYKTVATDDAGRFRMQGVVPGHYQLFAWEDIETGAWQDPEFIRIYEGRGRTVEINEGSDDNVQLTVIP
jgi:hypothetical protein